MTDRLLIVAALLLVGAASYLLVRAYLAVRERGVLAVDRGPIDDVTGAEQATLVYFSTASCGRCRDQARVISTLESRLGERVRVQKVDALADPELAERYRVLTVPTTVVLDGATRPRAVNYGFTPEARLEAQVRDVLSGGAVAA